MAASLIGHLRSAALAFLALTGAACGAEPAQPVARPALHYPALSGRVVDGADLLPAGTEQRLSARLDQLARDLGPQLVVVTVVSLEGYPIADYSIDLARRWGVGSGERNDGLMLLVAPNERKVRIEVGTGLERRVTDPYAARVIREQLLPAFSQGRFAEGIERGVDALIERLGSRQSDQEIARIDGVVA